MPSLTNCCAISRTAGLSSLLWHRKTSKIAPQPAAGLRRNIRRANAPFRQTLFGEVVAEIQGSCISGQFSDDMCLLGVELRRIGLADSSQKVA